MKPSTTLVGLIGWPVSHSASPVMHNAAFAQRDLDWCYVPLPVPPEPAERVGEALRGLRALGFRGANVTVPHKQAVLECVDSLEPAARAIGAINTLLVDPAGRIVGDNTDAAGFAADLRSQRVDVKGANVLVLGAGGSARAIVYALALQGAVRVLVTNRTEDRAAAMVAEMQPLFNSCTLAAVSTAEVADMVRHCRLIVNCTTQGMTPNVDVSPWPEQVALSSEQTVYDLVYNPRETRFLRESAAQGARAIGGLGMLIHQAALSFERWTGLDAPIETMRSSALAHFAAMGQSV